VEEGRPLNFSHYVGEGSPLNPLPLCGRGQGEGR
jgi:hypothetical protein